LLLKYGSDKISFDVDDLVFEENGQPKYYSQIQTEMVKLNHYNEDGKELFTVFCIKDIV